MAIDNLRSRKEQDQQLDQTRRDASANKNQGVRDHCMLQYQRYDRYQQEVQRQSKGKELALVEEKASLNEVAIGEDGKPVEKLILSEHYDDPRNPGLAGGVDPVDIFKDLCDAIIKYSPELISRLIAMAAKTLLDHKHQDKKFDEINRKLDDIIHSNYERAITYLNSVNSLMYNNSDHGIKTKLDELVKASDCFIAASSHTSDAFMQAKAMVFTGVCYELRGIRECAKFHYGIAYNTGKELWQQKTEEIKKIKHSLFTKKEKRTEIEDQLLDFDQFMVHLRNLVTIYPSISTSDRAAPLLLPQFSRMEEIASSSTTHDRITASDRITIEILQRENQRLQRENQRLKSQLDQALQRIQNLEKLGNSVTVGLYGDTNYRSISDAIKKVPEGTRILVRPGTYTESIILDKHVEIVGDGPRDQIKLISNNRHCISVATDSAAVVRGMTILGRVPCYAAIDIPRGRFHLSDCTVTCETIMPSIIISGSTAQPVIKDCIIRDGGQVGIFVYKQGAGVIEDCDIYNNKSSGIIVCEGGKPTVRRCKIHDGQSSGIYVCDQGEGTFEDCETYANKSHGLYIGSNTQRPVTRRCTFQDGEKRD